MPIAEDGEYEVGGGAVCVRSKSSVFSDAARVGHMRIAHGGVHITAMSNASLPTYSLDK